MGFVGRARVVARLLAAMEEAALGHARLVLVSGVAGIGKTTVVATAPGRSGLALGWGTCVDADSAPAFWPWTAALRGLHATLDPADVAALAAPDAGELARLLWELAADGVPAEPPDTDAARLRLFDAVATEVQSPKLVGSATESGANVFAVDYFGRRAYLAQSPQLFTQILVGVLERVYEVGPVFRAEPHDTVRHLAEYVSLDVELGFIRDHRDVLALLRDVLAGMVTEVRERAGGAVQRLSVAVPDVPAEFPIIGFADELAVVGAPADEPDFAPAHERALGEWARREYGSDFLAVEGYPLAKRPFYTHPAADGRACNGFDLLFRGTELVTGGQRLHRYDDYVRALTERGEDLTAYAGYLDTFRYGMPPHGGFAIGLERWTAQLTRAANIREVTLFPRDLHRLTP